VCELLHGLVLECRTLVLTFTFELFALVYPVPIAFELSKLVFLSVYRPVLVSELSKLIYFASSVFEPFGFMCLVFVYLAFGFPLVCWVFVVSVDVVLYVVLLSVVRFRWDVIGFSVVCVRLILILILVVVVLVTVTAVLVCVDVVAWVLVVVGHVR
jgi:hypothetical protein